MNDTQRIIDRIDQAERRVLRRLDAIRITQFNQLAILIRLENDANLATSLDITIGEPQPQRGPKP